MNEFTLQKCLEYTELGWLDKHESADGKLVGFKYSRQTVYDGAWDEITLQCRGIVFEKSTGKIVAHPFDKFFNYQEIYNNEGKFTALGERLTRLGHGFEPEVTKIFRSMDKIDGSLGIVFFYDGRWIVKTGGSFDADQAKWAQTWLDDPRNINRDKLREGYTYCFEIVYNGDAHVCHYDYEGLVLLGFFDEQHRESQMIDVVEAAYQLACRYSHEYKFDTMTQLIEHAKTLDVDHEGFVVTFSSGFKVKVKGVEYLERFKLISAISKKDIRAHFDLVHLIVEPEYKKEIPEELWKMREYADKLERACEEIRAKAEDSAAKILDLEGRERYEKAVELLGKRYASLAINLVTGRKINELIFRFAVEQLKGQGDDDDSEE